LKAGSGLPATLRAALRVGEATCYRHCDRPSRGTEIKSGLPGLWQVLACPSGVVSVVSYTELGRTDPSRRVESALRRWSSPASLVRRRDLRLATRHGPELGPRAERWLAAAPPGQRVRVVYWRVYPSKGADGVDRRLGVCQQRHRAPVFFLGSPGSEDWVCPKCSRAPGAPRAPGGRRPGARARRQRPRGPGRAIRGSPG